MADSNIKKSSHIIFNDTYIRDSQQWNWETHDATDIELNTNENPAEIRNTFAAASVYNKDRMRWSRNGGSENISVRNAIGWTRTAHCIRIGGNALASKPEDCPCEKNTKGYFFDNFHSVAGRKAGGHIRVQSHDKTDLPMKGELIIKNSSFWTASKSWALIPVSKNKHTSIRKVVLQNLYFAKPITKPSAVFSDIEELTIKQLHIGGQKIKRREMSGISPNLKKVTHFKNDFKD